MVSFFPGISLFVFNFLFYTRNMAPNFNRGIANDMKMLNNYRFCVFLDMTFIHEHFKYKKVVLTFFKHRDLFTTLVDVEGGTADTPHLKM